MPNDNELDSLLLSKADGLWRKVNFIVGSCVIELRSRSEAVTDEYLIRRVAELVRRGLVEARGNLEQHEYCEVRLPDSSNPVA